MTGVSPEQLAEPPTDQDLTKLHERAHRQPQSRPWRIVDWLVHQLDQARMERNAAQAEVERRDSLIHDRASNVLARQAADLADALYTSQAEVNDWRERWVIVDEDRCWAQDRAVSAEAALAAEREKVARVEALLERMSEGYADVSDFAIGLLRAALSTQEDQ